MLIKVVFIIVNVFISLQNYNFIMIIVLLFIVLIMIVLFDLCIVMIFMNI